MIRSGPWSAAMDVGGWLRSLGLGQNEALFRASDIDADILPELTDGDLEKLGVSLGHRKRLLRAISGLTAPKTSAAPAASTGAKPHDTAERRQLTVMFCDLVGSTALSVRFDPEELREEIRAYQNAVSGVVTRYDGFVAKFMGDGVLAYFGYPRAHEDDAERAVRAGLEIAAAVSRLETRGKVPFAVRIGIATAPGFKLATGLRTRGPGVSWSAIWSARARRRSRRWSARPPTSPHACRLWRNPGRSSSPAPPAA
jgi:SAM domain (Sterile alpha motif)/Adenylate and Guanylate cyclase catalytic domain